MGFKWVYRVLQEVFPQVDSRILRAVAIEHSKDADVAVEVILTEVIPCMSEQSLTVGSSNKSRNSLSLCEDGVTTGQLEVTIDPVDVNPCLPQQSIESGSPSNDGSLPGAMEDPGSSGQPNSPTVVEPVTSGSLGISISSYHDADGGTDPVCVGVPILLERYGDNSIIDPDSASSALICENGSCDDHDQGCVKIGREDVESMGKSVVSGAGVFGSTEGESALQVDVTTAATNDEYRHLHVDDGTSINSAGSPLVGIHEMQLAVTQEPDPSSSSIAMSEKDAFEIEIDNSEDESIMTSSLTRSDQNCSTKLLEDIIEDARNNKIILMSVMDSVVNLMREVELKEKAAAEAKDEAAWGCSHILAKVEELKQALRRAKEANDMHAGEVYAEKAILATELKELQLRLFSVSDERDRSLGILDEMHRALEIRLAAALKEMEAAEAEKLEKEQSAREALAYQESQMEKVVEESKRLKLEAGENSKLQEFLMDRGRAIDILQGEISVKCQDVKLLKEKFDKRISLCPSVSSSQTSSILASSSSSFRSIVTPPEPEFETYETPKKNVDLGDCYGFLDKSSRSGLAHSPKVLIQTEYSIDDRFQSGEKHSDGRKVLLEDGWELFDKGDFCLDA